MVTFKQAQMLGSAGSLGFTFRDTRTAPCNLDPPLLALILSLVPRILHCHSDLFLPWVATSKGVSDFASRSPIILWYCGLQNYLLDLCNNVPDLKRTWFFHIA